MSERFTEKHLVQTLRLKTKQTSQVMVAKELGLSPAFICDVLKGRREITERLARKMKYRRVVEFEKVA